MTRMSAIFSTGCPRPTTCPHGTRSGSSGGLGPEEQDAAAKTAVHANTPTVAYFDTLGRPFLTLAHNRYEKKQTSTTTAIDEKYPTRTELDIEGNQRAVIDAMLDPITAKGRVVMRYDYDMLGNRVHQASMEAGARWMLEDVAGKPIRSWDSRGHQFRTEYDPLRRPLHHFVQGTIAGVSDPRTVGQEVLFEKTVYGEGQPNDIALTSAPACSSNTTVRVL